MPVRELFPPISMTHMSGGHCPPIQQTSIQFNIRSSYLLLLMDVGIVSAHGVHGTLYVGHASYTMTFVYCTLYSVQCTIYSVHCIVYIFYVRT